MPWGARCRSSWSFCAIRPFRARRGRRCRQRARWTKCSSRTRAEVSWHRRGLSNCSTPLPRIAAHRWCTKFRSLIKHCRKKRRPITVTVNALERRQKEEPLHQALNLALAPITATKLTFTSPANEPPQLAHTKPRNVQWTIVYTQSPASFNIPRHRPYITPPKRIFGSQKACNLIRISHNRQTSIVKSHTQSSQRPEKAWQLIKISRTNIVQQK